MAATGVTLAFLAGCVILVLGQIFLTPLARLLGSTDTILPYARSYLRIILLGAPYMTASFVLNNQLRFQGSAAYGMVGIAAGAVLNVGLDPLLIFGLNMGVAGAALATILSQLASFCMLLLGCARGGNLRIRLKICASAGTCSWRSARAVCPPCAARGWPASLPSASTAAPGCMATRPLPP